MSGPAALVDMPNWLGDFCHTLPAVHGLRAAGLEPVLLAPAAHAPLAGLLGLRALQRPAGAGWRWARTALRERFVAALTARNSTRAKLLLRGVRAPVRLASRGRGARLLGLRVCAVDRRLHQRHDLDTALARLGCAPVGDGAFRVRIDAARRAAAAAKLAVLVGARPACVLLPGSRADLAKRYPLAHYAELARLLRSGGVVPLVVSGPGEEHLAAALGIPTAPSGWSLDRVAALLSCCAAAIGNDSGLTHLAALVGCPTVTLFGPTLPGRTAPVGGGVVISAPHARLADLPVRTVADAVLSLLAENGASSA